MINIPELWQHKTTIKRGHYGLVDASAKLRILGELVNRALETAIFRGKLDEIIEQRQALGATRRGEALENGRRRREEKERLKAESESNGFVDGYHLNGENVLANNSIQNGDVGEKRIIEIEPSGQNDPLGRSGIKHLNSAPKKTLKKLNSELKEPTENGKELSRKESPKQLKADKDSSEKNSDEQRKEYFEREMEKRFIRRSPLGKDRDYNNYWWFCRYGRIFVESCDSKKWGYYSSKEELDALMSSLNCKGERERALRKQLEKYYSTICSELQKTSKDLMHRFVDESVLRRSTRVRAQPGQNPSDACLRYKNKYHKEE